MLNVTFGSIPPKMEASRLNGLNMLKSKVLKILMFNTSKYGHPSTV